MSQELVVNSLPGYKTETPKGWGASSEVFKVIKEGTDPPEAYALKVISLNRDKNSVDESVAGKGLLEVRLLHKLKHPGIIRVKEATSEKNSLLILTELALGDLRCLCDWVHQTKVLRDNFKTVARYYIAQIVAVLEYLHENHVLHRDIKMENILLGEDYKIRVIDYGSAQIVDRTTWQQITSIDDSLSKDIPHKFEPFGAKVGLVGSQHYISPEMIRRSMEKTQTIDLAPYELTDIWSLGILVYRLFQDDYPFDGTNKHYTLQNILKQPLSFKRPVDDDVKEVIEAMLTKDVKERWNIQTIKAARFFAGVNFATIFEQNSPILLYQTEKPLYQSEVFDQKLLFSMDNSPFRRRRVMVVCKKETDSAFKVIKALSRSLPVVQSWENLSESSQAAPKLVTSILILKPNCWLLKEEILVSENTKFEVIGNVCHLITPKDIPKLEPKPRSGDFLPNYLASKTVCFDMLESEQYKETEKGLETIKEEDEDQDRPMAIYSFKAENKQVIEHFFEKCKASIEKTTTQIGSSNLHECSFL